MISQCRNQYELGRCITERLTGHDPGQSIGYSVIDTGITLYPPYTTTDLEYGSESKLTADLNITYLLVLAIHI